MAGTRDRWRLPEFLDRHAATIPRTFPQDAMKYLDKDLRQHYLDLRRKA